MRRVLAIGVLWAAAVFVGACGEHRAQRTDAELAAANDEFVERLAAERAAFVKKMARRMKTERDEYDAALARGEAPAPPVFDVLIVSGGGDYGAFGAGFLQGWGTIAEGTFKRPDFDVVTGVSTGALIAPFAFIGDNHSYERVAHLYREPKKDWAVVKDIFFFLPWRESFLDVSGLQRDIAASFDADVMKTIAAESKKDKLLGIGATNLDFTILRGFDAGAEAERAAETGDRERFYRILRASSAIPGAFPPVMLDGDLYVDGGVVANIVYDANARSPGSPTSVFRREYPGVPLPKIRLWVLVNNQLGGHPGVAQPTWTAVAARSLAASIRASVVASLRRLALETYLARELEKIDMEMRFVAIPQEWKQAADCMFMKETMESLARLGLQMGADPKSWRTDEPRSRTIDRMLREGGDPAQGDKTEVR